MNQIQEILNEYYLKVYGVDLQTRVADIGVEEIQCDEDLVEFTIGKIIQKFKHNQK